MMRALAETLVTLPIPLVALLVAGLVVRRRQRLSLGLIAFATAGLVGFSLPITAALLEAPLAAAAPAFDPADEPGPAAAIVVPTAGIYADPTGTWWASSASVNRAVAGRRLQQQIGLPMVLIGGSPLGEPESEAFTVARQIGLMGPSNGVPAPPVFMETAARSSAETARAAKLILDRLGARQVILVTTPSHIARMAATLRHAGLEVRVLPARGEPAPLRPLGALTDFLPSAAGLSQSANAVREYAAILWYLLRGHMRLSDLGSDG